MQIFGRILRRGALALLSGAIAVSVGPIAAQAQSDKNTLVVAVSHDLQNTDPTLTSGNTATWEFLTNVYNWLIDYEVVTLDDGTRIGDANSFVGSLAESFEWSNDGKTVTFKMRDGLKFSNGDPLTAEAVKFTFDRIFDQKGVTVGNMALAEVPDKHHIELIDSETVAIHLDRANSLLFGNMAQAGNSILNPKVVGPHMTDDDPYAHEFLKVDSRGTEQGPYRMDSWDPGNQYVLVRNDNYHGEPANIERIVFKIIPDPASRLAQLVSGAVDIALELPTIDIPSLEANPDITVHRNTSRSIAYIGMNNEVAPFDNKLVRQAISYAVPYDTIIDIVLNGYAVQLKSPIPFGTPGHTDQFFVYEQNFEKAKELLVEAGYPDGFSSVFEIPIGNQEAKETAVFLKDSLAKIGVDIQIQELPGAAYFEKIQKHELKFFFTNFWISINNDPYYHVYWKFHHSCCNYANYANSTVDQLIADNTISTDTAAQAAAIEEIQRILLDEAPWVLLYQPEHILAMRSNVKGYAYYSADNFTRYQYLYKE
ncbi:MAG: ABC transporter substrate-binding protein [Albidovulum sp.]|nr:ABC transporter substrate-binding protein [Albidovulum sp.]